MNNKILISNLDILVKRLKQKGIIISAETFKKYKYQGWMSQVFIVSSSLGPLIIHVANLVDEHKRNKVWEKFSGLAEIFKRRSKIPTGKIFYVGMIKDNFVLVQNYLVGVPAGKRILKNNKFFDIWQVDKYKNIKKILKALAIIHKIKLKEFGWPTIKGDSLAGSYKSWEKFFQKEASRWIREILETDRRILVKPKIKDLRKGIQKIIAQIDYNGPAVLVHGDAINPSNILVNNGKGIFLLDWEWSIGADPAWEFCDLGWWDFINKKDLLAYFNALGMRKIKEQEYFLKRIKLYRPLWLLWGTQMHARDKDLSVYLGLHRLLYNSMPI